MDLAVLVLLAAVVTGHTAEATRSATMPCDPGSGAPVASPGCPAPATGWLVVGGDGELLLQPVWTLHNDREGRGYAAEHDLEFPFSNDYLDVAAGPRASFVLAPDTVCTGSILVSPAGGLDDQRVACDRFELTLRTRASRITVAVWSREGLPTQVSELYRP